ncbi:hypothetical protein D1007_31702 [Hordeum vulgare]|nr:hypothetical protein D1007_31702 [Hordeum vulgare]
MPGLVSFFLRLIREDGRRFRRFHRRMQAIRRFGRDAAGRGYHGTRRDARGGYYASGSGLHATGCAHRGAPRARGPTPSAPAVHEDAAAPAPPPGSPPPPPPPPTAWMAPPTPTPAAETVGPSRGPPGFVPVPMRVMVDEEAALGFVSAPTGASGVVRLGVGMDGADTNASPPRETTAETSSRAERRFGRLFGRAVAALDRQPGRRAGSWAPASLGLGLGLGAAAHAPVVVPSSSNEEGSSVRRR